MSKQHLHSNMPQTKRSYWLTAPPGNTLVDRRFANPSCVHGNPWASFPIETGTALCGCIKQKGGRRKLRLWDRNRDPMLAKRHVCVCVRVCQHACVSAYVCVCMHASVEAKQTHNCSKFSKLTRPVIFCSWLHSLEIQLDTFIFTTQTCLQCIL